jgi:hypothetical protein
VGWLLLLLLGALFGVGGGGSTTSGPPEPAVRPTAIVLRSGGQTFVATRTLPREGNVDFELGVGKPVDVSVHGSHATRRVVTFSSWACTAPGARIVLRPGQRGFRVPRLMESPYEITVTSGKLRGKVMADVFGGPQGAC